MSDSKNTKLKEGFTQVVVWEGCSLKDSEIPEFEDFVKSLGAAGVQFLEVVLTLPDLGHDGAVPGTGGRSDILFAITQEGMNKFAIARLQYGMRWLDDVYGNNNGHIYPERIQEYRSWDMAETLDSEIAQAIDEELEELEEDGEL